MKFKTEEFNGEIFLSVESGSGGWLTLGKYDDEESARAAAQRYKDAHVARASRKKVFEL